MIRGSMVAMAVLSAALLAGVSASADPVPAAATSGTSAEQGSTSLGVPFIPRTGFFMEAQVGIITVFGGSASASNADLFTGLQLGYDIPGLNIPGNFVKRASVFLTGGVGQNDSDCHLIASGTCLQWQPADNSSMAASPTDFLIFPVEVGTRIGFPDIGLKNLFPYVELSVGGVFTSPALAQTGMAGFGFSGGVGVEYDTRLPGFNFGIEGLFRGALINWSGGGSSGMLFLPYLTIYPRFQYVF